MAAPDFRLIASANSDKSGHFDDIGAIGKTITPEIIIALCGPMGAPLHDVAQTFQELLLGNDYSYEKVNIIRLSDEIRKQKALAAEKSIRNLIEAGNELRVEYEGKGDRFISSIKKWGAVRRSARFEHNISLTSNASVLNRSPS
ncbi:hypothetical protein [Pseudomonas sp. NFACC49-2]|uniref:hypothetical protein n=1 Tax=Pseudomonas sp. NFACC49-2 TaxID=1566222 RepID=UPI0015A6A568|nr:hypothetical protein [Pseudomonas sp. NFACC49-2]